MDLDDPLTLIMIGIMGISLIVAGAHIWRETNPSRDGVTLKVLMLEHGDEWHNVSYAYLEHTHDDKYALIIHWHNETYAFIGHKHDDLYAVLNHTHKEYALIVHWHNETYALINHNHDDVYALINHIHDDKYATIIHWHNETYALINHNHDGVYALITHFHDDRYALITHAHNDIYYTKAQVDQMLNDYYTKTQVNRLIADVRDVYSYRRIDTAVWHTSPATGTATTTGAPTANVLRAMPLIITTHGKLDRIAIQVTTSASGNIRLGIYNDTGNLYPMHLIADAGVVDTGTTGVKDLPLNVNLNSGVYWLVAVGNAAPTIRCFAVGSLIPILGSGLSGTTATINYGYSVSYTYNPLPTTFPTGASYITATPIPAIYVRLTT